MVSATFGVIFVAAMYAVSRAIFPRSDLIAIVSAFIAATLYWAINFSRIGIETNGMPMLLALSAAALAHAFRKMQWRWVIGAGFLIGATVYTYLASRLWPLAVLVWFVYLLIFHRAVIRANFSKWVVMGAVVIATLLPLGLFFLANPVALSGRSGTVFTPETFLVNLGRTAGMFFFAGDMDPRDNLPGRPALDFVLALFFSIGLLLSVIRVRQPLYAFLIFWFVIMSLPSALTEFAPNFRRAIGAMPATILFCALGVDWLRQTVTARFASPSPAASRSRTAMVVLVIGLLALSAFWSIRAYFVEWASGTGLFYSFDSGLYQLARELAKSPEDQELFLSPDYDEHYTILWALDGRPIHSFDGRRILVLPSTSQTATYGIITREDSLTYDALQNANRIAQDGELFLDASGSPYARVVHLDARSSPPGYPIAEAIGDAGFATLFAGTSKGQNSQRGDVIPVDITWRVNEPANADYTTFAQLLGPPNPTTGNRVWAQMDKQPGGGTYPTTDWQRGQEIRERFDLKIPSEAIPGNYEIQVGMYLLETGERVPLRNSDGQPVENNALHINSFVLD
jgi:hypothetical protein